MTDWDREAFENATIDDMRAHGGLVTAGPLAGHPLLVMTAKGARTGERRRTILTYTRDGRDYIVAGTAGGSPVTPAWVRNVEAHPEVSIEVGNRTVEATAAVVEEGDRATLWDRHVAELPHFADYPAKVNRVIPMVRISPVEGE